QPPWDKKDKLVNTIRLTRRARRSVSRDRKAGAAGAAQGRPSGPAGWSPAGPGAAHGGDSVRGGQQPGPPAWGGPEARAAAPVPAASRTARTASTFQSGARPSDSATWSARARTAGEAAPARDFPAATSPAR